MTDKVSIFLWFDGQAEAAARFWTGLLPGSRIEAVFRPGGEGTPALTVAFSLAGRRFTAMNGGPQYTLTPAASLLVECEDQTEVDRLWDALLEGGGEPWACGWLKDRYGLSWQIVPALMMRILESGDPAGRARAMDAMQQMIKFDVETIRRAYEGP